VDIGSLFKAGQIIFIILLLLPDPSEHFDKQLKFATIRFSTYPTREFGDIQKYQFNLE
jgi:hypothetical protein